MEPGTNGLCEHSPDLVSPSEPICLTPTCGLPAFKRGLCSRCDAERRKYQKQHPEVTDADLVKLGLLSPKTSPPGRRPNTKERQPLWLPLAVVKLSRRKTRKATLASGT